MLGDIVSGFKVLALRLTTDNMASLDDAKPWISSILSVVSFLVEPSICQLSSQNFCTLRYIKWHVLFVSFERHNIFLRNLWIERRNHPILWARSCDPPSRNHSRDVLEIGSRWGSFAIRSVQKNKVTTLTLSIEQRSCRRIYEIDLRLFCPIITLFKHPINCFNWNGQSGRESVETYFSKWMHARKSWRKCHVSSSYDTLDEVSEIFQWHRVYIERGWTPWNAIFT